jgi:hypothetical protein
MRFTSVFPKIAVSIVPLYPCLRLWPRYEDTTVRETNKLYQTLM